MRRQIMYRVIIEFKDELTEEKKKELKEAASNCFNNRGGCIQDSCPDICKCIFEGDDKMYGCISLANLTYDEIPNVKENLKKWDWEDTDDVRFNHSVMNALKEYENGIYE